MISTMEYISHNDISRRTYIEIRSYNCNSYFYDHIVKDVSKLIFWNCDTQLSDPRNNNKKNNKKCDLFYEREFKMRRGYIVIAVKTDHSYFSDDGKDGFYLQHNIISKAIDNFIDGITQ